MAAIILPTIRMALLAIAACSWPLQTVLAQTPSDTRPAATATPKEMLRVQVKGQLMIPLSAVPSRLAIADPAVADIQLLDAAPGRMAGVLLVGNRAGSTELQIWQHGRATPHRWTVHVVDEVQHALASTGRPVQADVHHLEGRAMVTGNSASLLEHRKAVAAASLASQDGSVMDFARVDTSSMVQVEVKVVEVQRSIMKEAGINWAAGRGVGNTGGVSSGTWGGGSRNMIPSNALDAGFSLLYNSVDFVARLGLLESNGLARVLAEPNLVAMSGHSASFLAGGEIPVPVASAQNTQTVEYKPFGIGLTVSPTVLGPDRIALKVAPEASELDYTNGIQLLNGNNVVLMPALRTRRADTMIEMGDGESFVISGLVSRQTLANVSKFPFLGELPIIGAFFRNVSYSQEEKELVIVVTPRLVRPFARGVAVPLPGERQEVRNTPGNAWGHYLVGPGMGHQMPGFSR